MIAPRSSASGAGSADGSRAVILGRVRSAGAQFRPPTVERHYRHADHDLQPATPEILEQFVDRLVDYKAVAVVCPVDDIATQIGQFLDQERARRVVVPDGLPSGWLPGGPEERPWLGDDPPLSVDELDQVDGVITGCAVAVAETGTIVLDGGEGQGRRVLTLLPDLHVVVVPAARLVARVPDALVRLEPTRPLTWISGPSATSDIELNRVEGVHGPRRLRVVVATA
ncbi:MAG: LUD domain-containing protein [Acidimicrobiia bacterium]|nr:LUD domain-containing protein [Acidimicrobiia bacterium]